MITKLQTLILVHYIMAGHTTWSPHKSRDLLQTFHSAGEQVPQAWFGVGCTAWQRWGGWRTFIWRSWPMRRPSWLNASMEVVEGELQASNLAQCSTWACRLQSSGVQCGSTGERKKDNTLVSTAAIVQFTYSWLQLDLFPAQADGWCQQNVEYRICSTRWAIYQGPGHSAGIIQCRVTSLVRWYIHW